MLLVPKRHVTTYKELPAALVPEFALTAQRLEVAVETGLDVPGSMVLVNNIVSQSVPHLHLHVIPRRPKDGLRFFIGLAAGVLGAIASTRLVSGMLFQVQPHDVVTYAAVVGALGLLSLLATYLPARRATRIDPLVALRQE